jgi:putative peptidoglycan lipid II flippase
MAALLPVALVYMVVAQPFIQLAIHHGAVSQQGAHLVTVTLVCFAAGLPGFSAFFLLMRAFQAMQDTRTMFRIYLFENLMTVVAAPILSPLFGVPGLAVAWVGPYSIASVYAVVRLRRRVGALGGWLTVRALLRILIDTVITTVAAIVVGIPFHSAQGDALILLRLVVQVGVAGVVYLYVGKFLQIRELRPILKLASRLTGRP